MPVVEAGRTGADSWPRKWAGVSVTVHAGVVRAAEWTMQPRRASAGKSHPRSIFAGGGGVVPAGFAEGEQNCGIGDAGAVVGDGDAMRGGVRRGSARGAGVDIETGSSGAAGVLQELGENRGEAIGEELGDARDGAVVHARADLVPDGRCVGMTISW